MKLRGYIVSARYPEEAAVLVFAESARAAKRMGWRMIVENYMAEDFYTDVRVRWAKDALPEKWGATKPCVLEPAGCDRCEMWYSEAPVDPESQLCRSCAEGKEMWDE